MNNLWFQLQLPQKQKKRKQIMIATSSIGPGATNMVTAAAVAHSNRLPILILSGDVFSNRRPDPVLQQVEHFGNPSISVNDSLNLFQDTGIELLTQSKLCHPYLKP